MRVMIDCPIARIEVVNYLSLFILLKLSLSGLACACDIVISVVISVARLDCSNEVRNMYGRRYMHALFSI